MEMSHNADNALGRAKFAHHSRKRAGDAGEVVLHHLAASTRHTHGTLSLGKGE